MMSLVTVNFAYYFSLQNVYRGAVLMSYSFYCHIAINWCALLYVCEQKDVFMCETGRIFCD